MNLAQDSFAIAGEVMTEAREREKKGLCVRTYANALPEETKKRTFHLVLDSYARARLQQEADYERSLKYKDALVDSQKKLKVVSALHDDLLSKSAAWSRSHQGRVRALLKFATKLDQDVAGIDDLSGLLGISDTTIRKRVREGNIPTPVEIKPWRWKVSTIRRWLEDH